MRQRLELTLYRSFLCNSPLGGASSTLLLSSAPVGPAHHQRVTIIERIAQGLEDPCAPVSRLRERRP
ncbi:protein of unknown function [Methylocella tundrae]|uniref:Uncharacterized protein n=1 Tax=Methylocella tundrae TaxID=227605 RepID=A0A4U8YWR6_METTU|nr:protein of unknown function [Methylocella tundrae]